MNLSTYRGYIEESQEDWYGMESEVGKTKWIFELSEIEQVDS